jgi:nicotinamidase/pyrazinamidase
MTAVAWWDAGSGRKEGMTDSAREVLLVIDVQNDFCPGGALAVPDGDAIIPAVNTLARRFAHVVLTQDWHPPGHASFASSHPGKRPFETIELGYGAQILWPDHCVQGTRGARFHAGLDIPHAELVLRKGYTRTIDSYSAFRENDRRTPTGLAFYLRERGCERLTLCGLATDFCVLFSALDGCEAGFAVSVALAACRGIDVDGSLARALSAMRDAGVRVIEPEGSVEG